MGDKNYGFVKVAAATPKIKVADCKYNAEEIKKLIDETYEAGAQVIVFPELCITGYTCSDLFLQDTLLKGAKEALVDIVHHTEGKELVAMVGLPVMISGKLYNVAAVICNNEILGFVPKIYIPNYSEFYELRHFTSGKYLDTEINIDGEMIPVSSNIIFKCKDMEDLVLAVEICEDVWVPNPPSTEHALSGATLIANLSASDEVTGKDLYRKALISNQSARTLSAYIYADAGEGESSTDLVFAGHNIIAENGTVLEESKRFENETVYAYVDIAKLVNERRRIKTFAEDFCDTDEIIQFSMKINDVKNFDRYVDKSPFVPDEIKDRERRCEEILSIQSQGLKKRLEHTGCKCAVIGISGGLDSTLALLVTVRAFDSLNIPRENIIAVTMPGFGTTNRTYTNALTMIKSLGATLKEVNISEAVKLHFQQIEHDINIKDITYENAQARQRTYLLMDFANQYNGMVIGTGDMSELALGWATYNGDHMSMYGVNVGVPKTLIRHLVKYYADTCFEKELSVILNDVLATPVSPELLPPEENGDIAQKTEDVVGPYELHDFYLYYSLRFGFTPDKILFLADNAFKEIYDHETILKWLKTFYRRFFSQQFKRSCLPDGPKVGSVAVSPRGDLRMPSDACVRAWLESIETE